MSKKNLIKFILHTVLFFLIGFILSVLLWIWFGNNLNYSHHLDINFFATLCGVYTILALIIAIYQIVDLKDRQALTETSKAEVRAEMFRYDVIYELGTFDNELKDLIDNVKNATAVSERVINNYLDIIYGIEERVKYLNSKQQKIKCDVMKNCGLLLTLHTDLINDLSITINDSSYTNFKKNSVIVKIRDLKNQFSICQSNI